MGSEIVAGGGLGDHFDSRNPAPVFGLLGVVLVGGGLVVPAFETLLFAWGGTALFVALLLRFVMTGTAVSATVTTDIYAAMAGNLRRDSPAGDHRYVPDADGVTLVVGDREFDAVGERLLATSGDDATGGTVEGGTTVDQSSTVEDRLAVLADLLVNDLELATRVHAATEGEVTTVTVTGSRVGTAERFDHPVASVVGVGLSRALETPVGVKTTVENGTLVVTAEPTATG